MIRAILVDDEEHCLDTLQILIAENCSDVQIVAQCRSAESAIKAIEKLKPAVVFLDIEMPFMDGFAMLEQLNEISFAVIFTTSYDQYAIKAIRFSALDYLLKPIDATDLVTAVNRVQSQKQLPSSEQFQMLLQQIRHSGSEVTKIAVPTSDGFELIFADNILRCEAEDSYTHFHLKNNRKIIACRTLKDVESQLQQFHNFIRIHHSFIVNLNEVTKYVRGEGGYVEMSDGKIVNVSRSRKDALMKWF
jgi:two-component system, LytTR family, response regulator